MNLPDDPFKHGVHFDDACEAIGASVLECFASGMEEVLVLKEDGGWSVWKVETYKED